MARNESPMRQIVRTIVREEIANFFENENRSNFNPESAIIEEQTNTNGNSTQQASPRRSTGGRKGGRSRSTSKGRVTNPNDRRLRKNREVQTNA